MRTAWLAMSTSVTLLLSACAPQMAFSREDRARVNAITAAKAEDRARLRAQMAAVHTEWAPEVRQAVERGELMIGMNYLQTVAAWGTPQSRNRVVISQRISEIWTYNATTPVIEVWFADLVIRRVLYSSEHPRPEVPRGELGYLHQPPP